jgi:hypothetical protein
MFASTVFAQDSVTGNLITGTWSGVGAYAPDPNNCCSNPAGSQPLYDTTTGTIKFSYGQATVQQSIAVNQALTNAGTGIQVSGYSWGYDVRNMNGRGGQGGTDSLTVNTWLTNSSGQNVANSSITYNTQFDWTTVTGSRVLPSTVAPSTLGNVGISFTGKDNGFWAGLYGPEVRNVNLRLSYGIDPCATNPAYSTTCAGFSSIVESLNLVPNPMGYATSGSSVSNSYSINQALASAGSGITIHGFKWGYVANANGPYCAFWLLFCLDNRDPSVTTNVSITDNTGSNIYSISRTYTNSYNTTSYSYLFPTSRPVTTLGNFNFTATTNDQAYVGSMWSSAIYTPDPCVKDPMSSSTCKGYVEALTKYLASLQPPAVATTTTTSTSTTPTGSTTTTTTVDAVPVVTTTTTTTVGSPTVVSSPVTTTTTTTTTSSTQTTKESSGSSSNTSLALSIISKNSERDAAGAAVAQTAVAQAQAAATQAQQEAASIAATAVSNSTASSTSLTGSQQFTGSGIKANSESSFSLQTNVLSIASISNMQTTLSSVQQATGLGLTASLVPVEVQTQQTVSASSSIQTSNETYTLITPSALTDRSNPLNDSMEQKQIFPQSNVSMSNGPVVNKNAQDNDVAGGVSINRMALAPTGYGDYLSFTLRDSNFYAPKEVYKNQRNVDNARALRQMTNDSRHREMVELQYAR